MTDERSKPVWRDRKRILGLPISFTRYEVDGGRFMVRTGLLRSETNEILLYRILDIKLVRTLWQKIFGVGTITLYSADRSDAIFNVENIKKPEATRRLLSKVIEEERGGKGVAGRELFGAARFSHGEYEHDIHDFEDE